MSPPSNNIRVFVQWKDQAVFAGEDVECTITFRNVSSTPGTPESRTPTTKLNGFVSGGERQRKTAPLQPTSNTVRGAPLHSPLGPSGHDRGHRPSLSLNLPPTSSRGGLGPASASTPAHWVSRHHGPQMTLPPKTCKANEARTLQEEAKEAIYGPQAFKSYLRELGAPTVGFRFQPPALVRTPSSTTIPEGIMSSRTKSPSLHSRHPSGVSTVPNTPGGPYYHRKGSGSLSHDFRFPSPSIAPSSDVHGEQLSPTSPGLMLPSTRRRSPKPSEDTSHSTELLTPATRILSGSSMNGTPRSSAEFYSISNNSTETLASDYVPQSSARLLSRPSHARRSSNLVPSGQERVPETLMMGYVQIMGSFILDGSLVNQASFEEVKRKGVVGGQAGGGVVGVRSKRDSGIFGSFGWGNIGESIGGLLGTGELSSMKEMRGIARSKTVPLISTPQSILFVDLRLAPGESKTYKYTFTLPNGLPPSHKGKAIKVSYSLVVGTQRAATAKDEQQIRHVDVPFRVFGGINENGDPVGHDLLSPHIILRDEARTSSVADGARKPNPSGTNSASPAANGVGGLEDFQDYISGLLSHDYNDPPTTLLSPSDTSNTGLQYLPSPKPPTSKAAIDLAILRSNHPTARSPLNPNRFEIARASRQVALLMLARPSYRLGETITAILDFAAAEIPTYAIHATLESAESVDPAIALRSPASVLRATRKIHADLTASTLYARRVVFSPTIPLTATPEFLTTGVSHEWKLRVEFITERMTAAASPSAASAAASDETATDGSDAAADLVGETATGNAQLLELVSNDQRGETLSAVGNLACESFEVVVPVRVYGSVSSGASKDETNAAYEGLAI
ncbi:MAG: hypothetical protein M1825_002872 [Sarcosagium campestre]|nr:MAG: hypothetical protein M1825_002872 [Sarcosagium campestre]